MLRLLVVVLMAASVAAQTSCSFNGESGECLKTSECTKTSTPSSQGATGCEALPADVQCCSDAPATIPPASSPGTPAPAGMYLPQQLQNGDRVRYVATSSKVDSSPESSFKSSAATLWGRLGLTAEFGDNVFQVAKNLAGTDAQRAADLNAAFRDPNVDAVISAGGGWGCARIIQYFDYEAIANNPKVYIGYSDVTGCLNAIHARTGLVVFHGSMGVNFPGRSLSWFEDLTMAKKSMLYGSVASKRTINGGKATGRLIGGNMSVFTAMLGSPYVAELDGRILFLEEVREAPYRVDRWLGQLELAGVFKRISGFVWGSCASCNGASGANTLDEVIDRWLKTHPNLPAFSGSLIGHIGEQFVLPIGANAEIDADAGTIRILHSTVHENAKQQTKPSIVNMPTCAPPIFVPIDKPVAVPVETPTQIQTPVQTPSTPPSSPPAEQPSSMASPTGQSPTKDCVCPGGVPPTVNGASTTGLSSLGAVASMLGAIF